MEASNRGAYFKRVNQKGVKGIFECEPFCDRKAGDQESAVINAITGEVTQ